MVLAVDEHLERRAAGVDPALEPARRALQHVLLAEAEQAELLVAVEQVAAVDDSAHGWRSASEPSTWPATNAAMPSGSSSPNWSL